MTKEINAAGFETVYVYDGNGNLIQKTEADGYITEYNYDPRNLVDAINYSDAKEVRFAYDKNGELITMTDWNGTVNFALDALRRITSVNDQNEKVTAYTYDTAGNQTSIKYPDNTTAVYTYDLLNRLTNLKDGENQNTVYAYDAASQLISRAYANGRNETRTYDSAGQLLTQVTAEPTKMQIKTITHRYSYDAQGNLLTEYNYGAGGCVNSTLSHTYDALNRLTGTTDRGCKTRAYTYDSLGNLTFEQENHKTYEYWYNDLNQQVKKLESRIRTYEYTYDNRGNLTQGVFKKHAKLNQVIEAYTYDATNRMVKGVNSTGEESHYIYNGLGYLISNELIIRKNTCGYTGQNAVPSPQVDGVVAFDRHNSTEHTGGAENSTTPTLGHTKQAVHNDYVLDYTSPLKNVIMETESDTGSLTYRYTYGLEKVNAVITGITYACAVMQYTYTDANGELVLSNRDPGRKVTSTKIVKLWYHHDRLGSVNYLTYNTSPGVAGYVTYDDWGMPASKSTLKIGSRDLDLLTQYTVHPYDEVLDVFFAQARMYDADDRRFMAADPVKGTVANALTLVQYTYVLDNPLVWVDLLGLEVVVISGGAFSTGSGYNYEFIDTALLKIKNTREIGDEKIMWLVADAGWTEDQKRLIEDSVKNWNNVFVRFFQNTDKLIELINDGTQYRENDAISSVTVFSHGFPGQIALGYHHQNADDLAFTANLISKLDRNVFSKNVYFMLYSCRAGSTKGGVTNFAQTLADWTNGKVRATYSSSSTEGRTSYNDILGITFVDYILKIIGAGARPEKVIEYEELLSRSRAYSLEREDAVGGVDTPYPALQFPVPSTQIFTEAQPGWADYTPSQNTF